ncbi:hypothetical protein MXB_3275 [Myxobolus squamalis]|nr:hypothetical protein MXB_3275 [Myxobolus squamalis]
MLAELAMLSNNVYALDEMLKILNKRVNDDGKNWRHILKSLIVFQTLCLYGSDRALGYCKRTIHIFQQLRAFQYFDKDRRDVGIRIRELSKNLAEMLSDDNILKKAKAQPNEIKLFLKDELNKKYTAITQEEQIKNQIRKIDNEIRLARPQNPDEEMAQIKLAMELSLKEAQYKQV